MKKKIAKFLGLIISFCCAMPIVACVDKNGVSTNNSDVLIETTTNEKKYLQLNANSIIMYAGETYSLEVEKHTETGEKQTIETISYGSDSTLIASVDEKGLITAKQAGETYINITADGLSVSCFVTVKAANNSKEGLEIRFVEDHLYTGVSTIGTVCIFENGVFTGTLSDVVWDIEDESYLTVKNGVFMPKKEATGVVIKATCMYNGKEVSLQTTIDIVTPTYIGASKLTLKTAAGTTVSGKQNTSHVSTSFTVSEYNVVTGERKQYSAEELEVNVENTQVVKAEEKNDGTVLVSSVSVGITNLTVQVTGTTKRIKIPVEVAIPIAEIADLDILALATCNDISLLSKSYVLVNDIDYQGQLIYQIGAYKMDANCVLGYQWKYLMDIETIGGKTDYTFVERDKVGQSGFGLTDEEYIAFAQTSGLNANNKTFTGVFDGNGYSIKNAKLMYDTYVKYGVGWGYQASVFGRMDEAILKNIAFENLSVQSPSDCTVDKTGYILDKIYNKETKRLENASFIPVVYETGIVIQGVTSTFENVYVSYDCSNTQTALRDGVICAWSAYGSSFTHCVVDVRNRNNNSVYAFAGEVTGSYTVANNIAVGVTGLGYNNPDNTRGDGGNWWIGEDDWVLLHDTTFGAQATNKQTLEQSISTFDVNVWDMSALIQKNGSPKLRKGCST